MTDQQNIASGAFAGPTDDDDNLSHHSHDGDDLSLGYLSNNDDDEDPLDDRNDDESVEGDTTDEPSSEIPGEIEAPLDQEALASLSLLGSTAFGLTTMETPITLQLHD